MWRCRRRFDMGGSDVGGSAECISLELRRVLAL